MSISAFPEKRQGLLKRVLKAAPIYLVLIGLLIWIGILSPSFFQPTFFLNFLKRAAPLMILTAGQLFVIAAGGFDLSVGSLTTLTVLAGALLADNDPANTWWVMLALFGVGILTGLFNGVVTTRLKVPSFITTLGSLLMLNGVALMWTGGAPRGGLPDNFRFWGRETVDGVALLGRLPYAVIVLVVVSALAVYLFHFTNFGKQILATGDNPNAARLSGLRVNRIRVLCFVLSSLSAVLAGILLGGFSGVSLGVGEGYELQAISAAVLGGARLLGGRGNMPAALAGALTLQALFTLLNFLGLPKPLRDAVQGVIIISAVAYAAWRLRAKERRSA